MLTNFTVCVGTTSLPGSGGFHSSGFGSGPSNAGGAGAWFGILRRRGGLLNSVPEKIKYSNFQE